MIAPQQAPAINSVDISAPVNNAVNPAPVGISPQSPATVSAGQSIAKSFGGTAEDPLARFRVDADGKRQSDQEILQHMVDVSGQGSNEDGSPMTTVRSLEELVTRKYVPAIPQPPVGKKWQYEHGKVSLADSN